MNVLNVALTSTEPVKAYSIARFEELFQLRYYPQLLFDNWKSEKWIRKMCDRAHKKGNIGQLAIWLGQYHGKQISSGEITDISIRWKHEQIGYGLFTNRPFKKWEYIGEYTGLLRRRNLFFANINDYCFMYPKEWVALKAFTIDSENQGNYTRFINHSDHPNCESVSVFHDGIFHIIFRAIQDIPENTELFYDYGDIYWHRRKKLPEERLEDLVPPEAIIP